MTPERPIEILRAALARWHGAMVTVRVVAAGDELVAVCAGRVGEESDRHRPAVLWPLDGPTIAQTTEEPGLYVHPDLLSDVRVHPGAFVVEYRQGDVEINVRRLGDPR